MPTQEQLCEWFTYKDGQLYWKRAPGKKIRSGQKAGTLKPDTGYIVVCFKRRLIRAHRIIWTMFKGSIPDDLVIDHIDRNRSNNLIENLRLVTISQNARNAKVYSTNKSGVPGVYFHKGHRKWYARIHAEPYKQVVLGWSAKKADAIRMRQEAEKQYGYI